MPTGRWQLEQSFWTMEQAKAFAERMTTAFNGIYKFRTRERRPRVVRSHMRMA
jgi:hypothetical protein